MRDAEEDKRHLLSTPQAWQLRCLRIVPSEWPQRPQLSCRRQGACGIDDLPVYSARRRSAPPALNAEPWRFLPVKPAQQNSFELSEWKDMAWKCHSSP